MSTRKKIFFLRGGLQRKCQFFHLGHSSKFNMRSQFGALIVEFVIILPLLLIILFGIIEFSVALYDKAILTNASREGARAGVVYRVPVLTDSQIQTIVTNYCQDNLITFGYSADPTVTVTHASGQTSGNPLTVTAVYTYNGLLLASMFNPLTGSQLNISAVTTMNYE